MSLNLVLRAMLVAGLAELDKLEGGEKPMETATAPAQRRRTPSPAPAPAPEPEAETEAVTIEDLRDELKKLIDSPDNGRTRAIALLKSFKATKLGDIKPAQFGDVLKAIQEELAGSEAEDGLL